MSGSMSVKGHHEVDMDRDRKGYLILSIITGGTATNVSEDS